MIFIGIDPGINTGYAVIENGKYIDISTTTILKAMDHLKQYSSIDEIVTIVVENPHTYTGPREQGREQGAGSVKAHYKIWVEWAEMYNMKLIPITPKEVGSQFDNAVIFESATGWIGRTSKHARDAAKMIFKFSKQVKQIA